MNILIKHRMVVMLLLIIGWTTSKSLADTTYTYTHTLPIHTSAYTPHKTYRYDIYDWKVDDKTSETLCLAKNIYFEGRGESLLGQVAIGLVTINRVKNPQFPNSICEVVFENGHNREGKLVAQFSWTLDANSNNPQTKTSTWHKILRLAQAMTADGSLDNVSDFTQGATHYHATYIDPKWSNLRVIVTIDNHVFYRV